MPLQRAIRRGERTGARCSPTRAAGWRRGARARAAGALPGGGRGRGRRPARGRGRRGGRAAVAHRPSHVGPPRHPRAASSPDGREAERDAVQESSTGVGPSRSPLIAAPSYVTIGRPVRTASKTIVKSRKSPRAPATSGVAGPRLPTWSRRPRRPARRAPRSCMRGPSCGLLAGQASRDAVEQDRPDGDEGEEERLLGRDPRRDHRDRPTGVRREPPVRRADDVEGEERRPPRRRSPRPSPGSTTPRRRRRSMRAAPTRERTMARR